MTSPDATPPPLPALLPTRKDYQERLEKIVPSSLTGSTHTANPAASATAFVMMYVGAINGKNPIRPSTVVWMSDAVAERREDSQRLGYYHAALKKEDSVDQYCESEEFERGKSWYKANTRESIRDDTLSILGENGAVIETPGVDTTASSPRYTFTTEFAALLDPALEGQALDDAIVEWQNKNLSKAGLTRALFNRKKSQYSTSIPVKMPGAGTRDLLKGKSNEILKGVIESFTKRYLSEPSVLFISQSGKKVDIADAEVLAQLGMEIDPKILLPDCVIADTDPARGEFWFVEVVATDGPVHDKRKADILAWAAEVGLPPEKCRFLTAFESRTGSEAKKCLPRLASGSFAWFANEEKGLLEWNESAS
ncbi:BsuBI/PstI family type II restriction endonuclease [Kitasatospora sp. NPDC001119]